MPWKKKVAYEWLWFLGIALLSFPLGVGLIFLLDGDSLIPFFLIAIILIYSIRLTVWSIKQVRQKDD